MEGAACFAPNSTRNRPGLRRLERGGQPRRPGRGSARAAARCRRWPRSGLRARRAARGWAAVRGGSPCRRGRCSSGVAGVPWAMTSTPTGASPVRSWVHRSGHDGDAPDTPARPSSWTSSTICSRIAGSVVGQDPVTEVEDVAGTRCRPRRAPRGSPSRRPAQVVRQSAGSRLPWTARSRTDPPSRLVDGHPPVDADDGASRRWPSTPSSSPVPTPKRMVGDAGWDVGQLVEEPAGGGQHQLLVVARGQDPRPRVEDLHRRGPRVELGAQRRERQVDQPLDQVVPRARARASMSDLTVA